MRGWKAQDVSPLIMLCILLPALADAVEPSLEAVVVFRVSHAYLTIPPIWLPIQHLQLLYCI